MANEGEVWRTAQVDVVAANDLLAHMLFSLTRGPEHVFLTFECFSCLVTSFWLQIERDCQCFINPSEMDLNWWGRI